MLPDCSSDGGRPDVQGRPRREGQEEEEGHLVTHPVHHAAGQGTEHQLTQDLQSGQETVVGRLVRGERKGRRDEERG